MITGYDQIICKNRQELEYVDGTAVNKLGKIGLGRCFIDRAKYPIHICLSGTVVGWTDCDRTGDKFSFLQFVQWEQERERINVTMEAD